MAKLLLITAALLAADQFDALKKAVADQPNDAAADLVTLSQELSQNQDVNLQLQDEVDALKKINKELAQQIQSAPVDEDAPVVKPTLSDKTFTVDKVKYGFAFPALNLDGVIITNDDVLADKELQKKLVEMESGFIKAV